MSSDKSADLSDIEKSDRLGAPVYEDEDGAVHHESFEAGNTLYARLQRIAGKYGVEQRGIERVPENERTDKSLIKVATLWCSANMVVSSFAIGVLGQTVFFTGFVDGLLTILFINLLGITPVCFFSAFGPKFGLRQMILSRYWFGYYGVKVIALLNCVACIGWSSVNTIVGSQLINTVNPNVPGWAGCLIIAFCTFLITLFGYKVVHGYEMWSWIPCFIVFMIVLGEFAHSGAFNNIPMGVGTSEISAVLSFAATIYGFATGWTSYAADYTVYQPATTSRTKTFLWTWIGLIIPLCFTEMLGLAVATAYSAKDMTNPFTVGYMDSGIGGLLGQVLVPTLGGFGQFCMIILALGIIANNCPNIYSLSLSLMVLARWTQAVPRFVWTFVGTCIYIAIAIPGYSNFETSLESFLNLIGYWLAIYEGVAITDHFVFKRSIRSYDPRIYATAKALPVGIAAICAFLFGILGAVMGMSQVWFVGPIASRIGLAPFGADIGFELAFSFTAFTYIIFRTIELRVFGR